MVLADRSFSGVGTGAQVLSTSVFIVIALDGAMPGDCGEAGILCKVGPVIGTGEGAGAPDGIGTLTVVMGEGAITAVVADTNGCAKGGPGECPSPDISLIFDTVLNRGAFKAGAGTV